MAGAYSFSIVVAERARRVDACAADFKICESVLLAARRFLPLVGKEEVADERTSIVEVSSGVEDEEGDADAEVDESNSCFAACGTSPTGNDAAKRIGSSLHSGHICDPLP